MDVVEDDFLPTQARAHDAASSNLDPPYVFKNGIVGNQSRYSANVDDFKAIKII